MSATNTITELFKSSYVDLRCYIRRLGINEQAIDDIVQEAFLRTHQNADRADVPRAFLFTVAHHLAINSHRHDSIIKTEPRGDFDDHLSGDESLEELMIAAQQSDLLLQAVRYLPPKCRAIFSLRVFYGMSYRQLAQRFGLSEKTIEHHIARGLRDTTRTLRNSKT